MRVPLRFVRPGLLRLPPDRAEGADPYKLLRQQPEYGSAMDGMPPLEVTQGADGELMINNGVTRATRCYLAEPERPVPVQVIDVRGWNFCHLPTVGEMADTDIQPSDEDML